MPNAYNFPLTASGIRFIYNIPDYDLILSMQVYADIYHGVITTWNDSVIVSINPQVSHILSVLNQPIRVLFPFYLYGFVGQN